MILASSWYLVGGSAKWSVRSPCLTLKSTCLLLLQEVWASLISTIGRVCSLWALPLRSRQKEAGRREPLSWREEGGGGRAGWWRRSARYVQACKVNVGGRFYDRSPSWGWEQSQSFPMADLLELFTQRCGQPVGRCGNCRPQWAGMNLSSLPPLLGDAVLNQSVETGLR